MSEPEPQDQGSVRYSAADGIATLVFDRPAARNAMTWRMYDELATALARIEADPDIAVAVLRGAGGKAFIAGTDIEQFTRFASGEDGVAYERRLDSYIAALEALRVPSIAVVEGWAVGGGLGIANACDFRIATPGSRFGVPIARTLGNCLSPANLRRLTATLGLAMVKRMLLLAEMPTAEMLVPLGYVQAIVEPAALDAAIAGLCDTLRGHAPLTMRVTKAMLARLATDPDAKADDLIRACYGSEDFKAGVDAFVNKRTMKWQGK
jgi:enoyl-CoA hydratase